MRAALPKPRTRKANELNTRLTPEPKLFWLSWYQPTQDYRPITYPPTEPVLSWWCSGFATDGESDTATLCAAVLATDEAMAKAAILKSWPEAAEWRFCNERELSWRPGDRFPITQQWERERWARVK